MSIATDWNNPTGDNLVQPAKRDNLELNVGPEDYSLLTDLYQLTMAACYIGESLDMRPASFELFTRRLPEGFGYLIAMGLAQALDYLEQLRFTPEQINALQATGIFCDAPERFWSLLREGQFSGNVWAVQEGTAVFAYEPLLRVEAPLWQAQLVETYLLNTLNYQTLVATRAARLRDVAGPVATLLEFGTRRAFSPQASLWAARAALAAGMDATSNVLAALKLGRKPTGTMAHSLILALTAAQGSEGQAFTAFHHYFPGAPVLIDTFDTLEAARQLAQKLQAGEIELRGVRIDSGDLVQLSREVREILPGVPIFASGDLDEWEIAKLQGAGAIIDGYGLGTKLVTGTPVNGVYKLVELAGIPVMKKSAGKASYPGKKQIFRCIEGGKIVEDRLDLISDENLELSGDNLQAQNPNNPERIEIPLLQLVMKEGKRLQPMEPLEEIAQRTASSVASLPSQTRRLRDAVPVPLTLGDNLQSLIGKMQKADG